MKTIRKDGLSPIADALSQGTGTNSLFGRRDGLTAQDAQRSHSTLLARARRLRVEKGVAYLDEQPLTPHFAFKPSQVELLPSGFSLYHWSEIENPVS